MNRYLSSTDVPMKFHSFFRNVALPIGAFITMINLLVSIAQIENFHWLTIIDISVGVAFIILNILIYNGFEKWPEKTWYFLVMSLCLRPIYTMYEVILYSIYNPIEIGIPTGRFLMYFIYSILVVIYYSKRKFLFTKNLIISVATEIEDENILVNNIDTQISKEELPPVMHQKFCRNCGEQLPDKDTKYCIYCGKEVIFFSSHIIEER